MMPKPRPDSNTTLCSLESFLAVLLNLQLMSLSRPYDLPFSLLKTPFSQSFTLLSSYELWPKCHHHTKAFYGHPIWNNPLPRMLSFILLHSLSLVLRLNVNTSLFLIWDNTCLHFLAHCLSPHSFGEGRVWLSLSHPWIWVSNAPVLDEWVNQWTPRLSLSLPFLVTPRCFLARTPAYLTEEIETDVGDHLSVSVQYEYKGSERMAVAVA